MIRSNRWSCTAALLALLLAPPGWSQDEQRKDEAVLRQELQIARKQMDDAARRVAELSRELGEGQRIHIHGFGSKRPMLGFVLGVNEGKGVRLDAVTPDSPAAKAGLRSGDVITSIDGRILSGEHAAERIGEAQRLLGRLEVGQEVALSYERDGKPADVMVTAEALSPFAFLRGLDTPGAKSFREFEDIDIQQIEEQIERSIRLGDVEKRVRVIGPMLEDTIRFDAWRWQGLRLAPLDEDLGRYFGSQQGVLVLKAEGESLAGLKSGDVIVAVDGESVSEPREAMRRLSRAEPGQRVALTVLRDKRRTELALTAPEQPDVLRWIGFPEPPAPPVPPAPPSPPPPPPPHGTDLLI